MPSFLTKSPKKAKTPRSAIKPPSFVISTKPPRSPRSIKRSLTPNARNDRHFKNNSVHIIEVGDESDTDSDSDEHNLLTTPRAKKNGTMNQFETEYEEVVLPMERASTTGITDKISSVISKKKRDKSKK